MIFKDEFILVLLVTVFLIGLVILGFEFILYRMTIEMRKEKHAKGFMSTGEPLIDSDDIESKEVMG